MTRCRCREATNGGGRGRRVRLSLCSDRASRRIGATSAAAAAALSLSLCSERAQATARQAKAAARWRQPSPSPPSGPRRRHDRLYFTSLRVVCGTYEDCRVVPAILRLLRAASDGSGRPRRLFPAAPPLPRLLELGEAGVLTAAVEEQRRRRPGREQVLRESGARWAEVVGPPATVARRGASLPPLDLGEPRLSPSVGELLEDPAAPRFPLKASCRSQCSPWFRDSHHMSTRVCANSPLDCYPTCQLPRSFISDSTEIPICAAAMRLGCRAIFSLVRSSSSSTTTTTSAASSPPAVLSVGHALRERRRFTEADVAAYAAVSGDRNPVHLDAAAARELGGFHGGRVVHGMLVASLFPSIIAARFPGAVYASQTLKFAAPVYVGDDVVAQVQALHIRATTTANSSTSSRYVVKFATKCFADEEEGSLVIEGEAMALLPTLELSSESTSKE